MPMDKSLYPGNWNTIAFLTKWLANWQCQECGKVCRQKGEGLMEFVDRVRTGRISECRLAAEIMEAPQRFTLTVAHLDHDPWNPNARLKAMCAPCHGRYDLAQMERKRHIKREHFGQLNLLEKPYDNSVETDRRGREQAWHLPRHPLEKHQAQTTQQWTQQILESVKPLR